MEEKRINDVQVFIFTSDGTLDAYESAQGTTLQVRCTSGPKRMYVFANAPSLAAYSAESALKSAVTRLSDNYAGAFVMVSGLKEVNVSAGNNSMPVVVSRVAARVEVAKITNAMSSAQHQGKTFKVLAAYLTNVAANTSYDLSALPTDYYNKMGYHSSEVDALVYEDYLVSFGGAYPGKADAGVSACRFNNGSAWFKHTFLLCIINHCQGDAVFYASARVEILKFEQDVSLLSFKT